MITIKRKISFLLAFILILSVIYSPINNVYAASDIQTKVTLNSFDANDNLKSTNQSLAKGATISFNDVHIITPIKIELLRNPSANLKVKAGGTLSSFITLTENGDSTNTNLIGSSPNSILNDTSFNPNNFASVINLSPVLGKSFKSDKTYTLKIDTTKLENQADGSDLDNPGVYTITLNIEKTPNATITSTDNKIILEFDRKIDISKIDTSILNNNNIIFRDEALGSSATDLTLNQVAKSIVASPNQYNSNKSKVTINGVNNATYTVILNKNSIPTKTFIRQAISGATSPDMSSITNIDLPIKETIKNNLKVEFTSKTVSKNIRVKKSDSTTLSNISLANKDSDDNINIDVDSITNGNKLFIDLDVSPTKKLILSPLTYSNLNNGPVTIKEFGTSTNLNINIKQIKSNPTGEYDTLEITDSGTDALKANTKYILTIHKNKFLYNGDPTMPAGDISDEESYTFTTEKAPEFISITPTSIRQDAQDRKITITSSRPIQQMAVGNLNNLIDIINGSTNLIDTATLINDTTLELTLKDLSSSLGDTTIKIPPTTFKRKDSNKLSFISEYTKTFKITRQEDYLKISSLKIDNFSDDDIRQNAPNQTYIPTVPLISDNASTTIDKVYIGTDIEIDLNTSVKFDTSKTINDVLKLKENNNDINISNYYTITEPTSTPFTKIKLTPIKALKENTKYTLSINNSYMLDNTYNVSLGDTKFNIVLNTENKPKGTQNTEVNKTYSVTFDRKIDTVNTSNVELYNFVADNFGGSYQSYTDPISINLSTDGRTVNIINLPKGEYKIKLKDIKRINSSDSISTLKADEFTHDFEIKSLSDKVSKHISVINSDTKQSVIINKKADTNTNNTDIDVDTSIKVKFDIPYTYAANAFKLEKSDDHSSLTTSITNDIISGIIDGVTISPNNSLEANTKYTLIIDKSKFTDRQGSIAGALSSDIEEYEFTTELKPELTLETKNLEKGKEATLIIKSSKNIEQYDSGDLKTLISIKDKSSNPIIINSVTITNKNTITLTLDDISPNSVALGDATINIASTVFKRESSKSLKIKDFSDSFTISRASDYLKSDLISSIFTSSDKLESYTNKNILVTQNSTTDNVYIATDITIKLNDSVKTNKTPTDILKLSENTKNLIIDDYFNITINNISTGFDTIKLESKKALNPNSTYTLTLDNSSLKESSHDTPIGNTKFTFILNTEKKPMATQNKEVNKIYSATFTRKIDKPTKDDINLFILNEYGRYVKFEGLADSNIELGSDHRTVLIKDLPKGKYKISLNTNEEKVKRISDETAGKGHVYAQSFVGAIVDENKEDFEIKSLASTVSDYIELKQYTSDSPKIVQINKLGEANANNTQIETNTNIKVKFTIPYTYTNNAFAIVPALNTTAPSLEIKAISKTVSSSGAIDGVNIELKENLLPDTRYKLILYKNKFKNSQDSFAGNAGDIEEYEFTTETSPILIDSDVAKIEKKLLDQNIILKFDKNIDLVDSSKITIDGTTAFSSIRVSDNILSLSVSKDLANLLEIKEHKINIASNAIKRLNSKNVYVKDISTIFNVIQDQVKKAQEDAKKKEEEDKKKAQENQIKALQEEREAYKTSVANVLASEMQKRYQDEYGSNYDFKSFNDYIKDKYIKEKGKLYNGSDYIQAYLKEYGYVDDFITKYGRNSNDLKSYAQDYMNRYGSFAYSDREKYDNPFFMNPFRDSSSKRGYYDYYNKYDYGYKYPEMRVGDDNISQANLEKEQKLKQKEEELIQKERGYNIRQGQNYSPTGNKSPKIVISQNSRYFSQEDEFGNKANVDMGIVPVVSNGRLFVAVTPLANKLGLWVNYDSITKTATFSKPNITSSISLNSSYITINGKSENMGIRPLSRNNKIMIPAHYIAKAFGLDSSKVSITSNTITINNN